MWKYICVKIYPCEKIDKNGQIAWDRPCLLQHSRSPNVVKICVCKNLKIGNLFDLDRPNLLQHCTSPNLVNLRSVWKKANMEKIDCKLLCQQCRTWGEREQLIPLSCSASLAHNCLEYIHISLNWAIYQQIFTCLVFGIFINLRFGEYLGCW